MLQKTKANITAFKAVVRDGAEASKNDTTKSQF